MLNPAKLTIKFNHHKVGGVRGSGFAGGLSSRGKNLERKGQALSQDSKHLDTSRWQTGFLACYYEVTFYLGKLEATEFVEIPFNNSQ